VNDWTVTPLAASLGARIDGVRLTEASEVELAVLQDLLDEHHLLLVSG
jgi:alpha-ketoglutarate-dependent taurine dioxygenase